MSSPSECSGWVESDISKSLNKTSGGVYTTNKQNLPNKRLLLLLRQLELLVNIHTAHVLQHGDGVLAVTEVVDHDSVLLLAQ